MHNLKRELLRFTSIKFVHRTFQGFKSFLQGLPQIYYGTITKELLQNLINKPNPTIIEIGSSDGYHTQWFFEIFDNPQVYCFEPDPRAIARFKNNIGENSNVQLFELAISSNNGDITFFQSSGQIEIDSKNIINDWDESGSIRQPKDHLSNFPLIKFEKSIQVKTLTLDSWCAENGIDNIDFIWMDVQGAERDVFEGGLRTLSKTQFLYTEYSNKQLYAGQYNLKQILIQLEHFEVIKRYPADIFLKNKNI